MHKYVHVHSKRNSVKSYDCVIVRAYKNIIIRNILYMHRFSSDNKTFKLSQKVLDSHPDSLFTQVVNGVEYDLITFDSENNVYECEISDISMTEIVRYMRGYTINKYDYDPRDFRDLRKDFDTFNLSSAFEPNYTPEFKQKVNKYMKMIASGCSYILKYLDDYKDSNPYMGYIICLLHGFDEQFLEEHAETIYEVADQYMNKENKPLNSTVKLGIIILSRGITNYIKNKTVTNSVETMEKKHKDMIKKAIEEASMFAQMKKAKMAANEKFDKYSNELSQLDSNNTSENESDTDSKSESESVSVKTYDSSDTDVSEDELESDLDSNDKLDDMSSYLSEPGDPSNVSEDSPSFLHTSI